MDDESDYFTVNSQWISEERREALQKKEAALREAKYGKQKGIKITLDIAGRQVKEEDDKMIGKQQQCKHVSLHVCKQCTCHYVFELVWFRSLL